MLISLGSLFMHAWRRLFHLLLVLIGWSFSRDVFIIPAVTDDVYVKYLLLCFRASALPSRALSRAASASPGSLLE